MKTVKPQAMARQMAGTCLSARVRRLNRLVSAIYDEALRPHGIRASQLNILVAVSAFGPLTSRDLCQALRLESSTLSRSVSRMQKRSWLTSEPSGDGKILKFQATTRGLAKIEQVHPAWQSAQSEAMAVLGDPISQIIIASGNRHADAD